MVKRICIRTMFSVIFMFANVSRDKNRWPKVTLQQCIDYLSSGPYSGPNVIIYFERLWADCYAVSLLKRHTTLPESHVASDQG